MLSPSSMELSRALKYDGKGTHRVVPPSETLSRLRPLLEDIGVTRLADLTGLDRIGVPTYGAVVPDSRDVLSVYNGKGATRDAARAGALMEAVERRAASRPGRRFELARVADLGRRRYLDPGGLVLAMHADYSPEAEIAWIEGTDLVTKEPVLVPIQAVTISYEEGWGTPCYKFSTTNGLASGNTLEEAVCHALCELVERDAWTFAELLAMGAPRLLNQNSGVPGDDDLTLHPSIDLDAADGVIKDLWTKFRRCDLTPIVKDLTSTLGIPVVLAAASEALLPNYAFAHFGLGAHPDAEVAIIRALSELAQSRAVDVQGVREDLSQPGADYHPYADHTKRSEKFRPYSWYNLPSPIVRAPHELRTHRNEDILADIDVLIESLRSDGMNEVIAVDLTEPEIGVPVVRILVPGIESWAGDRGRFGPRATRAWSARLEAMDT